jgi:hypothetical protein
MIQKTNGNHAQNLSKDKLTRVKQTITQKLAEAKPGSGSSALEQQTSLSHHVPVKNGVQPISPGSPPYNPALGSSSLD